ncbi:MAG: hypothetical protein SGJ04_08070 [Bacteroidota bacterium]|nr:hypothetical protein [Bacteroidota bacterium]
MTITGQLRNGIAKEIMPNGFRLAVIGPAAKYADIHNSSNILTIKLTKKFRKWA